LSGNCNSQNSIRIFIKDYTVIVFVLQVVVKSICNILVYLVFVLVLWRYKSFIYTDKPFLWVTASNKPSILVYSLYPTFLSLLFHESRLWLRTVIAELLTTNAVQIWQIKEDLASHRKVPEFFWMMETDRRKRCSIQYDSKCLSNMETILLDSKQTSTRWLNVGPTSIGSLALR